MRTDHQDCAEGVWGAPLAPQWGSGGSPQNNPLTQQRSQRKVILDLAPLAGARSVPANGAGLGSYLLRKVQDLSYSNLKLEFGLIRTAFSEKLTLQAFQKTARQMKSVQTQVKTQTRQMVVKK